MSASVQTPRPFTMHLFPARRVKPPLDLTGITVGQLTVERPSATTGWFWCRCTCGVLVLRSKRAITNAMQDGLNSRCDRACTGAPR